MSQKLYNEEKVIEIANKIREHNNTTNKYKISEMANGIESIADFFKSFFPINTSNYNIANALPLQIKQMQLIAEVSERISGTLKLKATGSNIFNNVWELGTINGTTGLNQDNNNLMRCKDYIEVEELTQYKFSSSNTSLTTMYVYEYKADKSYNLTANKGISLSSYLTTNAGTKYIRIRPANFTPDLTLKVMLNVGISALPFEEHKSNEISIDLKGNEMSNGDILTQTEKGETKITKSTSVIDLGKQKVLRLFNGINNITITNGTMLKGLSIEYYQDYRYTQSNAVLMQTNLLVDQETENNNIINDVLEGV